MKQVIKLGLFFISAALSISSVANPAAAANYGDSLFVECGKHAYSDGERYVITYVDGSPFNSIPSVGGHCANSIASFLRANIDVRPFHVEQVSGTYYYWFYENQ